MKKGGGSTAWRKARREGSWTHQRSGPITVHRSSFNACASHGAPRRKPDLFSASRACLADVGVLPHARGHACQNIHSQTVVISPQASRPADGRIESPREVLSGERTFCSQPPAAGIARCGARNMATMRAAMLGRKVAAAPAAARRFVRRGLRAAARAGERTRRARPGAVTARLARASRRGCAAGGVRRRRRRLCCSVAAARGVEGHLRLRRAARCPARDPGGHSALLVGGARRARRRDGRSGAAACSAGGE